MRTKKSDFLSQAALCLFALVMVIAIIDSCPDSPETIQIAHTICGINEQESCNETTGECTCVPLIKYCNRTASRTETFSSRNYVEGWELSHELGAGNYVVNWDTVKIINQTESIDRECYFSDIYNGKNVTVKDNCPKIEIVDYYSIESGRAVYLSKAPIGNNIGNLNVTIFFEGTYTFQC